MLSAINSQFNGIKLHQNINTRSLNDIRGAIKANGQMYQNVILFYHTFNKINSILPHHQKLPIVSTTIYPYRKIFLSSYRRWIINTASRLYRHVDETRSIWRQNSSKYHISFAFIFLRSIYKHEAPPKKR